VVSLVHFKPADTYHLGQALWADYPFLAQYFDFDTERQSLTRTYRPPSGFRRVGSNPG
jgi:hypothetical protein